MLSLLLVWTTAVAWITRLPPAHSLQRLNSFLRYRSIANLNAVSLPSETRSAFSIDSSQDPVSESGKPGVSPEVVLDYDGPTSDFSFMEAGCVIEDLGIEVLVGESTVPGAGRGLFVALQEGVQEVTLPRGTPICGYSKGNFTSEGEGDKTVAYAFQSIYTGVIYNKQIISLKKLIQSMINSTDDISGIIDGHSVLFDNESQDLSITPTEDYRNRYFIPFELREWSPASFGTQANDLAYHAHIENFDDYIQSSVEHNLLHIVWRMDFIDGKFKPTWPVVIVNRDVRFTNAIPMEVGIHYSWNYWSAYRSKLQSSASNDTEM